jgi:hypothetical protein
MSIDEKKTCTTHTKEKERLGICCQKKNKKKQNKKRMNTPLELLKTGVCIIGAMKHDRR